tara:strand:- start:318 stop:1739 length:1422 start_codon:yes stop_codon:yes gene_type:complete
MLNCHSLINGYWIKSSKKIPIENPANQKIIGYLYDVGSQGAKRAIESAHNALPKWSGNSAKYRSEILKKWYSLIKENKKEISKIITLESGKPLKESEVEVEYGASFIEWFAEQSLRVTGEIFNSPDIKKKMMTVKQPIGVVSAITPWNFPLAMVTRKTSAALACGCTVVLKPSELTPITSTKLAELALKAGIPPGVLNVVNGNPKIIGKSLSTHPSVKKITFTGSTVVGKLLMKNASDTVKSVSLELGGNAPFVVFDDSNLKNAINGLVDAKFRNAGQTCISANRVFVQESVKEKFLELFIDKVKDLKLGDGMKNFDIGPLINYKAILKLKTHIKDALKNGAELLHGGYVSNAGKLFFQPTVLSNVNSDMLVFKNENFGPLVPVISFKNDENLIKMCNDTSYGLAAYFYSQNSKRIWNVSEKLEFGMVGVNTGKISTYLNPFGGFKESGIGREGSTDGLEAFLEKKYISWDQN